MEELGSSLHQAGGVLEVDEPGEHGEEDRVSGDETVDQPQLPVSSFMFSDCGYSPYSYLGQLKKRAESTT